MTSDRSYKWVVVGLLWFVCFFNYADRQAIFSIFPLLKNEMHLSDVQLGLVGSSFMWFYAASAPLAGLIGDRFSRKVLVISGLIFWSLITVATALSTRYEHLLIFRALEGFGEAFYFPASMSLISDYHSPATRSRAMSLHQSSVYAGSIAGGTVSGVLGQHYGWRSGFYLFGGLGILLGALLIWKLKEPQRGQAEEKISETLTSDDKATTLSTGQSIAQSTSVLARLREVCSPIVLALMAVFIGANFVAMIFLSWMPSFIYRKFGMSLSMAGFSGTAYLQTASVAGVLTGGVLADRLARKYQGGRMMAGALGLIGGVPFIFLTGWTLSVPVFVLAMVGFGYFKGLYDANIWASLHDVVRPGLRSTAVGVMNSVGWIGGGTAPIAIALASERYGMSACLSASSLIYLLFGILLIVAIKFRKNVIAPAGQLIPHSLR